MTNLHKVTFTFPAIDNHCHPLLKESHRDAVHFDGVLSEAQGAALAEDGVHTLAGYRATKQLSRLYGGTSDRYTWEEIKEHRTGRGYEELCKQNFEPANIQCLLIDDGLGGVEEMGERYTAHDRFTSSPSKRIVRVEVIAEVGPSLHIGLHSDYTQRVLLESLLSLKESAQGPFSDWGIVQPHFQGQFEDLLELCGRDPDVVGFKSIVCYRTGLDVSLGSPHTEHWKEFAERWIGQSVSNLRLEQKEFNDWIVCLTMKIAAKYQKPGRLTDSIVVVFTSSPSTVQFHTGVGDNDLLLSKSSPALLQPLIRAFPDTPVVLLHASYPFTREAGYLAAVYKNVYLDFGEVFPWVGRVGQKRIVEQILELCPVTKALWSSKFESLP
jgi:Amidohydrolase